MPHPAAHALLHTLAGNEASITLDPATCASLTEADVTWLAKQGVAAYLYTRLRDTALEAQVPEAVLTALRRVYRVGALREAMQYQEAATAVLAALQQAGVETVLMKGMALASTVYADPRSRPKSDLDLWIQPDQRAEAIAALEGIGYRRREKESRPTALRVLYGGEQQMVSDRPGTGLIELQWPAIRGEWVRRVARVEHEAIWQRRVPLVVEGQATNTMQLEDMLLHVCVHQAINHSFGAPWLRALLDVHLLAQQKLEWSAVVARAGRWRVATVTWTMLTLAQELLGSSMPHMALDALAPPGWQRAAIGRLRLRDAILEMWPSGLEHRRFIVQTLMADCARDAAHLLWGALFPEQEWLRTRYGAESAGALWRARVLHPFKVVFTAKA